MILSAIKYLNILPLNTTLMIYPIVHAFSFVQIKNKPHLKVILLLLNEVFEH